MTRAQNRIGDFLVALRPEATQERHEEALRKFYLWCRDRQLLVGDLNDTEVDILAADYVLDLHDEGLGVTHGHYLIAALRKRHPALRLPTVGKVVARWRAETPPTQALALPYESVFAFFSLMWATERREMGLAALTCFCGLLRVGEVLRLRAQDVLPGPVHDPSVVLVLGDTKRGRDERIAMANALLHKAFRLLLRDRAKTDSVFGLSYFALRKWFLRGFRALGLPPEGLRSHGLRRRGAT